MSRSPSQQNAFPCLFIPYPSSLPSENTIRLVCPRPFMACFLCRLNRTKRYFSKNTGTWYPSAVLFCGRSPGIISQSILEYTKCVSLHSSNLRLFGEKTQVFSLCDLAFSTTGLIERPISFGIIVILHVGHTNIGICPVTCMPSILTSCRNFIENQSPHIHLGSSCLPLGAFFVSGFV